MKFKYRAKTLKGEDRAGEIEAPTLVAATELLRKQNLFITSIKGEENKVTLNFFDQILHKVSGKDKIMFTEQLAVMLQSGLSIVPALMILQKQTENKNFAKAIGEITEDVKAGKPLSESMLKRPDIFTPIYAQVARSGEKSGKLDKVMLKLASDLAKSNDLNSQIKSALIYPAFILSSLIVVIFIMMIFVIPQLESLFKETGVALPLSTRILIGTGKFMQGFWWLIILAAIGLVFLYRWAVKIPGFKSVVDSIMMKIPVFGSLQKKVYLARFVRTLSLLTSAGLPVLESFKTLVDITDNIHYKNGLKETAEKIESGHPIGESLGSDPNFPPLISEMVTVGEKSGNLEYILRRLAKFLEKDVSFMSKNMTTLLEPMLMIVMGVGVAFVMFSILGPIYGLVQVIK